MTPDELRDQAEWKQAIEVMVEAGSERVQSAMRARTPKAARQLPTDVRALMGLGLDALLAARVRCDACFGTGEGRRIREPHPGMYPRCPACSGSGFGGSLIVAMTMEQVGWKEGPAHTEHGYVLNIEPVREDSVPVYVERRTEGTT